MDLNKFFELFGNTSGDKKTEKELEDFKKTPSFKIKIFVKLVMNGVNFKKQIINFFSKSLGEDEDLNGVDLAGEFMVYNRGWYWISQMDWDSEEWIADLKDSLNEDLFIALKLSIHYFEEQEEYEKCAFLKKIQNFVEENLEL